QNGASINLSNVLSGGSFTVSISNSVGSVLSNPAVLNVVQNVIAPSITSQPASLTVNAGQNASFTVAASGTSPFNYQWKKDGVNVDGATTDTLNLTNAMDTQAGNYTVSVSNSAGSITSQVAQLIVQTPASIVTQPVPAAGNQGGSASFSVVARGSPVIAYQWKKDGVNLPNQVNPTLNLNNLQPSDMGNYSVTVFNLFGSVTSDSVSLSLSTSPVITAQPMSQTVQSGSSATFSVSATGSSPLSYQWKFNGVDIQGAVSSSYTLNSAITSSAGTYSVVVSNSLGSMTSAGATLVVISAPQILSSPQSMAVNIGANVTFNVIIASDPSVVFQWQKDGVNIPGATGTALSLTNIQISDAGAYKVIANNSVGFVTSQDAILSVNQAPTITQQPVSVSVNSGGNTSLSVTATSNQPLSYQWQKDGALISGATMATLSLTNVQLSQAGSYKVSVSNSLGTVVSSAATLTVTATKLAAGNAQFTAIDAGLEMFCGISPEQYVYCWGSNATGLGDGSTTSSADAVSVPIYNATKITVGGEHACALTSTGKVYCWGNNNYGQLGVPNVTSSSVPVSVSIPGNVIAVSAGSGHTCAVTMNSDVYCWGNNNFGQLGQGVSGGYSSSPVKITTDMNFPTDVAAGGDHTCVAGPNSVSTYCFGYGGFCELGNAAAPNSTYCSSVATPTPYRLNFTLAAGGHISLGQMTSSAVVSNYWYQWGIYGADSKSNVVIGAQPTYRASGVTEVVEALASKSGTFINSAPMLLPYRCILYTNQTISCQDTNLSTTYLYSVGGVPNPVHLAVGGTKACALRSDNLVNCWSLPTSGVSGNLQRK
ncbi:MAG: immunoglobulin domain-containing protein, partial [Pseudobdellovibrio sp.]